VHASVGGQAGARAQAAAEAMDAAAAAGVSDPVVVGAIGFRPDDEASLVVPAVVRRAAASNNRVSDRAAVGSPPGRWSVTPRPERRGGTAEGAVRAWSGTDRGRPDLRALVALPVGGVESGRTRLRGRRHHLGGPGAALADRGEPGTARRTTSGHGGGQPARRI